MHQFSRRNVFTVSLVILGVLAAVGCLGFLLWDSGAVAPRRAPTTTPTPFQTRTATPTPTTLSPRDLAPTPELSMTDKPAISTLPVESIPASIQAFEGPGEQGAGGAARLIQHAIGGVQAYTLAYSMPEDGREAFVGLAFTFENSQDLSAYGYVQVTIDFGGPDASCDFYIRDDGHSLQTANHIRLGDELSGDGISYLTVGEDEYLYTIPLDTNFRGTDFSAIREIGFRLNAPDASGEKEITFRDIKFVSP